MRNEQIHRAHRRLCLTTARACLLPGMLAPPTPFRAFQAPSYRVDDVIFPLKYPINSSPRHANAKTHEPVIKQAPFPKLAVCEHPTPQPV